MQVRGLNGIDAEWITQREFLRNDIDLPQGENQLSETDADILRMDHLEPVMFYVHGGGYYFGSISESWDTSHKLSRSITNIT
jgi:acetyl esterase/lipase